MKFTDAAFATAVTFITLEPVITHHLPQPHPHNEAEQPLQNLSGVKVYGNIQFSGVLQQSTEAKFATLL